MAATDTRTQREGQRSIPNVLSPDFSALGMERLKTHFKAQAEFIATIGTMNEQCYDHMQSETKLASEFALKLAAIRSIPDAMAAWQEWTSQWFELVAEDGRHLLDDTQNFIAAGKHLQAKSWRANPVVGGT
jgi:hypothetical protein